MTTVIDKLTAHATETSNEHAAYDAEVREFAIGVLGEVLGEKFGLTLDDVVVGEVRFNTWQDLDVSFTIDGITARFTARNATPGGAVVYHGVNRCRVQLRPTRPWRRWRTVSDSTQLAFALLGR